MLSHSLELECESSSMDINQDAPSFEAEDSFQVKPEDEVAASAVLTPPSIHHDELIIGASYAHYTPIPEVIVSSGATSVFLEWMKLDEDLSSAPWSMEHSTCPSSYITHFSPRSTISMTRKS